MSKWKKLALILLGTCVAFVVLIVGDWFRFVRTAQIDPKRGIYADKHLEIFIDINARMPSIMRLWACKTLRERERAVLGGQNTIAFYSCQDGFSLRNLPTSRAEVILSAIGRSAIAHATPNSASDAQKAEIAACVSEAIASSITPDQRAALDAGKTETGLLTALNATGSAAGKTCRSKAGL